MKQNAKATQQATTALVPCVSKASNIGGVISVTIALKWSNFVWVSSCHNTLSRVNRRIRYRSTTSAIIRVATPPAVTPNIPHDESARGIKSRAPSGVIEKRIATRPISATPTMAITRSML